MCKPMDTRSELHVAFITSFGGEFVTSESIPAVKLAADVINADEAILPGYKLIIDVIESGQLPAVKKSTNSNVSCESIQSLTYIGSTTINVNQSRLLEVLYIDSPR